MNRTQAFLVSMAMASVFSTFAEAGQYTVSGLGALAANSSSSAKDINSAGQVVGWSTPGQGVFRPFLWSSEQGMTDLGTPAGTLSAIANGINDNGWAVGTGGDAFHQHAILWRPGQPPVNLGQLLGLEDSGASAINNNGEVVGVGRFSGGTSFAFLWSEASGLVDIGSLAGDKLNTNPQNINDDGKVIGNSPIANGKPHAFLWSRQQGMTDIYPTYPNLVYNAAAINASGQIVGMAEMSNGKVLPALWNQSGQEPITPDIDYGWAYDINSSGLVVGVDMTVGTMTPAYAFVWDGVNPPARLPALAQITGDDDVRAVNDIGWAVGSSINEYGHREAVLWIPEPSTALMVALGGLTLLRRRKQKP